MEHIEEKILELYVLEADEVKDSRSEIELHLKKCAGCASLHQEMMKYYEEVNQIREERAEETSQALTLRSMIVRVPPFADRAPVQHVRATLPARVVLFIIRHPVVSSTTLVAMFLAGLLLMAPKTAIKDSDPAYARAKDEFLIAYNKEGQELWRKHIDREYGINYNTWIKPEYTITTIDVDKDGSNEVLSIRGWLSNKQYRNVVLCFNSDGSERWRYELHRNVTIGGVQYFDDWWFYLMAVGDYDGDGKLEVIAAACDATWFPNVLVRLNASDGSFVSEYWHNGMLHEFQHRDIDGDGVEELFFAGQNNRLQGACVVVLDPRHIEGNAPAPQAFMPQGIPPAQEEYYLLLPPTDLKPYWSDITNEVMGLIMEANGRLEVVVQEILVTGGTPTFYAYFDSTMECVHARAADGFAAVHTRFEAEGKVTKKLDKDYFDEWKRNISYWDGEKFVNQPTMNKRYLEAMKQQPIP